MAIEHNDFVGQTTNRQTVLNILRAREREPMHFTSFSNIAGKVQGTGQLSLNSAFNGDNGQTVTTNIDKVTSGATGVVTASEATVQVAETLSRGATNILPNPQISVTTGTDFQIAVNASEEFYRGILGPLSSGIVVHYLRQGFPPDLLSHLVIRRLEFRVKVTDAAGGAELGTVPLGEFVNSPDDQEAIKEFEKVLKCWQLATTMRPVSAVRLPAPPVRDLSGVAPEILGRIKAIKDDDGVVRNYLEVSAPRNEPALALGKAPSPACEKRADFKATLQSWVKDSTLNKTGDRSLEEKAKLDALGENAKVLATSIASPLTAGEQLISQGVGAIGVETLRSESDFLSGVLPASYRAILEVDITLRSVEGILYYLGEYVRNGAGSPRLRGGEGACEGKEPFCLPIIRVLPASQVRSSERFIDVIYRGRRYAVPMSGAKLTKESGRSSQTISLVQQLLNLHRSSKDLPITPLVRVQN